MLSNQPTMDSIEKDVVFWDGNQIFIVNDKFFFHSFHLQLSRKNS